MSITPYLDAFDADPETKRVLAVALEMTRVSQTISPTAVSRSKLSSLPRLASAIPVFCEAALKKLHEHLYTHRLAHCQSSARQMMESRAGEDQRGWVASASGRCD